MRRLPWISTLPTAFALCAACAAAGAQATPTAVTAAANRDLTTIAQARASVQAAATAAHSSARAVATAPGNGAAELFANPDRAYPPSCLNAPLTTLQMWQDDPNALQAQVNLIGDPYAGDASEANYVETDTITLFRVVCTGGMSATLLEIDRPVNVDGTTTRYPTFPGVSVAQAGNSLNIRLADDPNTFLTTIYPITPVINSQVYVLENFYGGSVQFDYNGAFTLTVDNFNTADPNRFTTYNLAAYNKNNYGEASLALPISGYMTSNWFDPNHGGEGTLTQIFDNADGTRTFTAAWYTFDQSGIPFWLYSQGTINVGDRSTGNVDTYYATNGCFAGVGVNCTSASFTKWGTINFSFPNCDHMTFTYSGTSNVAGFPTGSGTRTWLRIANVNGLTCK